MTQEVSGNPSGAGGQTAPKAISVSFNFGTYTNTFEYHLLYSLKKKDFIKGYSHKGLVWAVEYRLLPGRYVLLSTHGYRDSRGAGIKASLVYLNERGKLRSIDTAIGDYVVPGRSENPVVQAFFDALPGYHDLLYIPSVGDKGTGWEEIKQSVFKLNEMLTDPEA
ncbi:MAG: hypothetical protein QXI09_03555 [Candidatus Aenigmatarchaeota archaeon]